MTVEQAVAVTCTVCGVEFELSARHARDHRTHGTPVMCGPCRRPPKPPDARTVAEMRRWGLARYDLAELRSWPPLGG